MPIALFQLLCWLSNQRVADMHCLTQQKQCMPWSIEPPYHLCQFSSWASSPYEDILSPTNGCWFWFMENHATPKDFLAAFFSFWYNLRHQNDFKQEGANLCKCIFFSASNWSLVPWLHMTQLISCPLVPDPFAWRPEETQNKFWLPVKCFGKTFFNLCWSSR